MLGAAGDEVAKTPNLDRIADRGVMFEQAYGVNPICSPSRISIYTGKEPAHHGFYGNMNWAIEDDCPEFLPTQMNKPG